MRISRFLKQRTKSRFRKLAALQLALLILFQAIFPSGAYALGSGPSQPEVQSFEPVGTSEMVDMFSGDFNYNIPLMDVEGYPINISYHSGITMDEEASMVGLGWNINPGVINRGMRGIPDDFNGEEIKKTLNMRPNRTYGVSADAGIKFFGKNLAGLNFSYGIRYNNYTGVGIEKSFKVEFEAGTKSKTRGTGSLGFTSSSDEGLTVQASVGLSNRENITDHYEKAGLSVGTSFNSRGGLKALTIEAHTRPSEGLKAYLKKHSLARGSFGTPGTFGTFDFGTPTYTPQVTLPKTNIAVTARFTIGGEVLGTYLHGGATAYFSGQKLAQTEISNPAYGYFNSEKGQGNPNAILDFNREKDIPFTPETPNLPVTNYTFDTYNVSGQGVGGSFRPFRSDLGYVADAAGSSTSDSYSIGVDLGLGNLAHLGVNLGLTDVQTNSGDWSSDNNASPLLTFRKTTSDPLYEKVYFKEANDKSVDADPSFYNKVGGSNPERFLMDFSNKFAGSAGNQLEDQNGVLTSIPSQNYRVSRERRNQDISLLSWHEYPYFAIDTAGIKQHYAGAKSYHIAEITNLGPGGSRYVYGIAAYNTKQVEATFAIGGHTSESYPSTSDMKAQTGLCSYQPGVDNSQDNKNGVDYYFNKTEIPPYAHSYLLTAVLSPDYVDADKVRGPSDGDLGNYTRFVYKKVANYKWRTPFELNKANFCEGLKSDYRDDKGNYVYGEKELWYLDTIVSKNYIAIFYNSTRLDAVGVKDENGGYSSAVSKQMMKLDSIALFSKKDFQLNRVNAIALKKVHFRYSYALCPNVPNNINFINGATANTGKLTLDSLFFTYQNSNKAALSPYVFNYNGLNPSYNLKGYDRWGNFKPNTATSMGVQGGADADTYANSSDIPTSDFPYVQQDPITNTYASAWTMTDVFLPSGGHIKATFESDDYAYVQDRKAGQMFKIVDYESSGGTAPVDHSLQSNPIVDFSTGNGRFYFKLQNGVTDMSKYLNGVTLVYFRFLVLMRNYGGRNRYEYVSGYAPIIDSGQENGFGFIVFNPTQLSNLYTTPHNPVLRAALQYGRINMSKTVWGADTELADDSNFGISMIQAMINSDVLKNMIQFAEGPNYAVFNNVVAQKFVSGKSWIRLSTPNAKKMGGGIRVKKIEMIDEWGNMVGNNMETFNYGQEYDYTNEDGSSSGVASYEPQLGGDENPWKQPVYYDDKKLLIQDDEHYMEEPFGECFFPSPSVGYSKVTVKNLQRTGVKRHATGSVVHEFYTSRDYPIIPQRTSINHKRDKSNPFGLSALFHIAFRDYETATQGYSIELNDMHGKPKSQKVYQEGVTTPISSVTYYYKNAPYNGNYRLQNNCDVVYKDGTLGQADIGRFFDFIADMREETSETISPSLDINLDDFLLGPVPAAVPAFWPSFSQEKTRFRSATTTKVIQRFGIMDSTVATDLGSVVATKNLAYDAETGETLLTKTTTNFNDNVYALKYPAYWYYQSMGPAYQNIGLQMPLSFDSQGNAIIPNASRYYNEGDELELFGSLGHIVKGWVLSVTNNTINVVLKTGIPVSGGKYGSKVMRSGKRNVTGTDMENITCLTNPIKGLGNNIYENVLQASAVEFGNKWKTYCDCFINGGSTTDFTTNPYVLGNKGNWRPTKSYLHLTGRSQSKFDGNTNIRNDGVFTSFLPYYRLVNGQWTIDGSNWTYTSEVTEMNPQGQELENRDALGRYSAATFGYNQTFATSVAANSRYKEIGFDNFEDYGFNTCADDHFKAIGVIPTTEAAHSGKNSLAVSAGNPVGLVFQLGNVCTDTSGCHTTLSYTPVGNTTPAVVKVIGGIGPYSISKTILNGSPKITLLMSGDGISIQGTGWQVSVTITDSKGCTATQVYTGLKQQQ